jgi:hypothetical protein
VLVRQQASYRNLHAPLPLPEGKKYHYFMSHKKTNSTQGSVPNELARSIHDNLRYGGFKGFFDVDGLRPPQQIRDCIDEVLKSCVMIVCLHGDTTNSRWCREEWDAAIANGIPIQCLFDMRHASKEQVIEQINQLIGENPAYQALLERAFVEYTEQHRDASVHNLENFLFSLPVLRPYKDNSPRPLLNSPLSSPLAPLAPPPAPPPSTSPYYADSNSEDYICNSCANSGANVAMVNMSVWLSNVHPRLTFDEQKKIHHILVPKYVELVDDLADLDEADVYVAFASIKQIKGLPVAKANRVRNAMLSLAAAD